MSKTSQSAVNFTEIQVQGSVTNQFPLVLWGSVTGVTAVAGGVGTVTFVDFFNRVSQRGDLKIYAFSPALGTAKVYLGGYQMRTINTLHDLGTASGLASVEIGNGGTGGSNISVARSNLDLIVTVDFTDGASVPVTDGEVHVYTSYAV